LNMRGFKFLDIGRDLIPFGYQIPFLKMLTKHLRSGT